MPALVNQIKTKKLVDRSVEPIHGPTEPIHKLPPPLLLLLIVPLCRLLM